MQVGVELDEGAALGIVDVDRVGAAARIEALAAQG